jgi:hypothetical protein
VGNSSGSEGFCVEGGGEPGLLTSFDEREESGTTPDGADWELTFMLSSEDSGSGVDGPGNGDTGYAAFLETSVEAQTGSVHFAFTSTHHCYDAGAYAGFSFYTRGSLENGRAEVVVHTIVDAYSVSFEVPANWGKRGVHFDQFTTGEEGEPFDPTRITEIEFWVSGGPIDFRIDDLSWL